MSKALEAFASLYCECITVWAKALLGQVFFALTIVLAMGLVFIVLGLFRFILGN